MPWLFAPQFTDLRQYAFSGFFPATSICAWVQKGQHPVKNTHAWPANQATISLVLNSNTVQPNPSATKSENVSMAPKIAWIVLIIATLYVCYFSHLGAIGFVGPDEPRYAWIARDMVETGDWVTPRLYGKPWFEKPVLYYWGAAASFKLFGVSEAAARLPSALSALLATLALAWLALRLYGAETARWLLLLLPTTVGMIGFSHAAATDMPFSAMLTVAMVCAAAVLRLVPAPQTAPHHDLGAGLAPPAAATPQSLRLASPGPATRQSIPNAPTAAATPRSFLDAWPALILFGFFLGLAVLAKGPAAIILSGGAVFFWALFTKRWRDAFRLFHPAAIAAFCATALPWYLLCARRNPDFLRIFILEHNFKRYLTPEFQHIQPPWFYLPVLLVAFLPWTAIFLWSTIAGGRLLWRKHHLNDATLLLLCWGSFCLVFFSISHSKLPGYILPAIPTIGLLLARELVSRIQKTASETRWVCLAVSLPLVVIGLVAYKLGDKIPFVTDIRPAPTVMSFATWTILAGVVVGLLGTVRPRRIVLVLGAMVLPIFMAWGTGSLWLLDDGVSARPAAVGAINHLTQARLDSATTYKLQRGLKFSLNFYLHREIKEWSPTPGGNPIVFTTFKNISELEQMGIPCFKYVVYPAVVICGEPPAVAIPSSAQEPERRGGNISGTIGVYPEDVRWAF
jgi:4-amino-4-deoxy-L-arabinose transferase-like glycosyltransferase